MNRFDVRAIISFIQRFPNTLQDNLEESVIAWDEKEDESMTQGLLWVLTELVRKEILQERIFNGCYEYLGAEYSITKRGFLLNAKWTGTGELNS